MEIQGSHGMLAPGLSVLVWLNSFGWPVSMAFAQTEKIPTETVPPALSIGLGRYIGFASQTSMIQVGKIRAEATTDIKISAIDPAKNSKVLAFSLPVRQAVGETYPLTSSRSLEAQTTLVHAAERIPDLRSSEAQLKYDAATSFDRGIQVSGLTAELGPAAAISETPAVPDLSASGLLRFIRGSDGNSSRFFSIPGLRSKAAGLRMSRFGNWLIPAGVVAAVAAMVLAPHTLGIGPLAFPAALFTLGMVSPSGDERSRILVGRAYTLMSDISSKVKPGDQVTEQEILYLGNRRNWSSTDTIDMVRVLMNDYRLVRLSDHSYVHVHLGLDWIPDPSEDTPLRHIREGMDWLRPVTITSKAVALSHFERALELYHSYLRTPLKDTLDIPHFGEYLRNSKESLAQMQTLKHDAAIEFYSAIVRQHQEHGAQTASTVLKTYQQTLHGAYYDPSWNGGQPSILLPKDLVAFLKKELEIMISWARDGESADKFYLSGLETAYHYLGYLAGLTESVAAPQQISLLAEFSRNLTEAAMNGLLDPLVGRNDELERLITILVRRTKNNPVLIGESGVGKTAIVEGLAQRIASGNVTSLLADKKILTLDLSLIVAGTKYRGQFEERLKTIMKELMEHTNTIVFIDELHALVGAGSATGSLDAANILKPALSRGEIQVIGATTPDEYRKSVEKDRSLERRFQAVRVPPSDEAEAIKILQGLKRRYEEFHTVDYTDEAIQYAVYLSNRYIPDRLLPDKAIDLIDEAGSRVKLRMSKSGESFGVVTREDIEHVVSDWTGNPVSQVRQDEMENLMGIENTLAHRIINQDKALTKLARAIRRSRAGIKSPSRPVGSFLFLGPTGVGKTEVARRLAEFLFGSEKALLRFDMSEYMEKHAVAKLIGAPPGYVGHEEGGQLTERVRRTPYSVILLDEIEKAHPDIFNILLQVFEDGQLTDGMGRTVDFRNTIIIMTSNIGARRFSKRTGVGFQTNEVSLDKGVMQDVKRMFNPEFLNRLDEVVIFNPLGDEHLKEITYLQLAQVNELLKHKGIKIVGMSRKAEEHMMHLIVKEDPRSEYAARNVRRLVQKHIQDELAWALIAGDIKGNTKKPARLSVDYNADANRFVFIPAVDSYASEVTARSSEKLELSLPQ